MNKSIHLIILNRGQEAVPFVLVALVHWKKVLFMNLESPGVQNATKLMS